jgi:hypothetical protein
MLSKLLRVDPPPLFPVDERAQESSPSSGAKRSRKSFAPSSQGFAHGLRRIWACSPQAALNHLGQTETRSPRQDAKTKCPIKRQNRPKPKRISRKSTHEHGLCSAPRVMNGGDFIRPLFDRLSLWSRRGRFRSSQVVSFLKIPNGLFGIIS